MSDTLREIEVLFEYLRDNADELEIAHKSPELKEKFDEITDRLQQAVFEACWYKQHTIWDIAKVGQIDPLQAVRYVQYAIQVAVEKSLVLPEEYGRLFGRN
jgi:hypothetical protein